VLCSIKVTVDA